AVGRVFRRGDGVVVAGGGGPLVAAVGLSSAPPAGMVFGPVVAAAQGREILRVGRAAGVPGLFVVQIAAVGAPPAAGEHAHLISGDDEIGQVGRRPVGAPAVVEQLTGDWVGDQ